MTASPVHSRNLLPALAELIDHFKYKADRATEDHAKIWEQAAKDLRNTINACHG